MIAYHDPDEWESTFQSHTCSFHKRHPSKTFAGCACSTSFGSKRREPSEVARIKAEKRLAEENRILAEAEAIRLRRAAQGIEAREGQDAKRLDAKHESPVAESDAPKPNGETNDR